MNYLPYDPARLFGFILAGGHGTRMEPLTRFRAKGAVPFLVNNRIVDLALSNLMLSGVKRIFITTQSNPWSLQQHIQAFSDSALAPVLGEFAQIVNPGVDAGFFQSDAHSLLAIKNLLRGSDVERMMDFAVIMMSDQVLRIDIRQVIRRMLETSADMAMVYTQVPKEQAADKLGVLTFTPDGRVADLHEKLSNPPESTRGFCSANLALYVVRPRALKLLFSLISDFEPAEVLSKSALPSLIHNQEFKVVGYDLADCIIDGRSNPFFFDLESPETLHRFSMKMLDTVPPFDVHSQTWPILTTPRAAIASKIGRLISIADVMLGYGTIIEDKCELCLSLIGRNARVGQRTVIKNSIIMDGSHIGPNCYLDGVIIDRGVIIPEGTKLYPGVDLAGVVGYESFVAAAKQNPGIDPAPVKTPGGIIVIPKHVSL